MHDRKTVMSWLEGLTQDDWQSFHSDSEVQQIAIAALALLKEQEPKPMLKVEDDDLYAWSPEDVSYYCPQPECGKEISYNYNFCPYCGQAVKLDG